jgi:hypothetical protein
MLNVGTGQQSIAFKATKKYVQNTDNLLFQLQTFITVLTVSSYNISKFEIQYLRLLNCHFQTFLKTSSVFYCLLNNQFPCIQNIHCCYLQQFLPILYSDKYFSLFHQNDISHRFKVTMVTILLHNNGFLLLRNLYMKQVAQIQYW